MSAREYLVSHGRAGSLGRFRTGEDLQVSRGSLVAVQSRRGLELGEVLSQSRPENATLPDEFIGELLRLATLKDRADADRSAAMAIELCDEAAAAADQLMMPFTVIDAEVMLDGRGAILHGITHAACDLGPLLERIGESRGLIVRLYDMSAEPLTPPDAIDHEEALKCDKPDCGEGECSSCGTDDGGCNSCSAGGAKELAVHFSQLREQMEKHTRVPLG